jgi:hypothetical protein
MKMFQANELLISIKNNKLKTMKILTLVPSILLIAACSSTTPPSGSNSSSSQNATATALKDQKLSTDFTDEGIKITYTLTGKLESIEVFGQAEAWRGNVEALAEADAMAKLTKFIYGSAASTQRHVKIIGLSMDAAQDNDLDKFTSKDGSINITDKEIEQLAIGKKDQSTNNASSNLRNAQTVNSTLVTTVTNLTAQGRLVGVRKVRDFQRSDGKVYVAVYVWSEKDQAASEFIKKRMQTK